MSELIIMRGLPASGKTTRALACVRERLDWVRVNRDDLRAMLHGDRPWSIEDERITRAVRDAAIAAALARGRSVISDDTNLMPHHIMELTALADAAGATVRIMVQTTPIEECIRRDARRARPVGAGVIRAMAARAAVADGDF